MCCLRTSILSPFRLGWLLVVSRNMEGAQVHIFVICGFCVLKGSVDFTALSASFCYIVFLSLGNRNRLKCAFKMSIYKFNICLLFMDLNFVEIF